MSFRKRFFAVFMSLLMVISYMPQLAYASVSDAEQSNEASANVDGLQYEAISGGIRITGYTGESDVLEIPAEIDGSPVIEIGKRAFENSIITQLIIPEGVTTLGPNILIGNTGVKEIVLPTSVTSMDGLDGGYKSAFNGSALVKVTVSDGMTVLPRRAFMGCGSLTEVVLPDGMTTINNEAFKYCDSLQHISLPESITGIGNNAFSYTDLQELILPDGVTSLGASIIYDNKNIKEIVLPASVTSMDGLDGGYKGAFCGSAVEKVTVSAGMTVLPKWAFQGCGSLTEVVLPDGMTTINNNAFKDCTSLQHISLPDSITKIDNNAFSYTDLQELILPDGITSLGASIIYDNKSIKEIVLPASVTGMDGLDGGYKGAFYGSALEKVTVSEGMTELPSYAFQGCGSLTEVVLPDGMATINNNAFRDCTSLQHISLPDSITEIGKNAFIYTGLQELILPDGVTTLGASIIYDNKNIKEIVIPASVETMHGSDGGYKGAFCGSALEKVTVSEGMTELPSYAFQGCGSLTEVVLPDGMTTINNNAFRDCTSLQHISLPDSIKIIGKNAFIYTDLQELSLPDGVTTLGASIIYDNKNIKEIVIPASVEMMHGSDGGSKGAFYGSALEKVTVREGMTELPEYAFDGCSQLTEVSLPISLNRIGSCAFRDCTKLGNFDVPENISSIGSNVFQNDNNVKLFCNFKTLAVKALIQNGLDVYENGVKFVDSDEYLLDPSGSSYSLNTDSTSINGCIPLTAKYKIKDSWFSEASGIKVDLFVPRNAELIENTIMLNGEICRDYSYNDASHVLSVPVSEASGTISFDILINETKTIYSYAAVTLQRKGTSRESVVGAFREDFAGITITCDDQTSKKEITVSGVAPKSKDVRVYINDTLAETVTSKKNGSWSAKLTLPDNGTYCTYTIRAASGEGDSEISAFRRVTYQEAAPSVTSLVVEYNNGTKRADILNSNGVKPLIYFTPETKFVFKVGLENTENVDAVYINSTRNNTVKQLKAEYDEASGLYVTHGYFDPNDTRYVPGTISVSYDQKGVLLNEDQMQTQVVDRLVETAKSEGVTVKDQKVTQESDGSECVTATVDMSKVFGDMAFEAIKAEYKTFDKNTGYNVSEVFEMFDIAEDAIKVINTVDGDEMTVGYDFSDPKDVVMVVSKGAGYADKIHDAVYAIKLSDISWQSYDDFKSTYKYMDRWSTGYTVASYALDTAAIYADHYALVDQINKSSSITNKTKALREADELAHDQFMFMTLTTVMGVMIGATAGSAAIPAMALLACIKISSDVFWQGRTNHALTGEYSLKMVVDPSGYIYDTNSLERIPEATVTAYWIPDDGSAGFWDKKPADNEYGEIWDAGEYEQENPLQTNDDGRYAWDVPAGWWRVKTEKEGYKTTWSDWVPVPPVQTDVNIGLLTNTPEPGPAPKPDNSSGKSSGNSGAADSARKAAEAAEASRQGVLDPKLPKVKISKPKAAKKAVTVKWKKLTKKNQKKAQRIEIWVCPNKAFGPDDTVIKTASKKKASIKVKKLKAKKKYYIKVRTVKYAGGVKYVSKWSKVKKIKIK